MKRTASISILTLVAVAFLPLAANCEGILFLHHHQKATTETPETPDVNQPAFKYDAYIGFGYTSLNQVNGSRYGLLGAELAVTRYWGKHLGLFADGAAYDRPLKSPDIENSTITPKVDVVLFGPVFEAKLYGHTSIFLRGLLGAEHTGGTNQTPDVSLAGGVGVGMDYQVTEHIFVRAVGDDIASSFSEINNTPQLAYSPHRTRSSRATFGIAYKF